MLTAPAATAQSASGPRPTRRTAGAISSELTLARMTHAQTNTKACTHRTIFLNGPLIPLSVDVAKQCALTSGECARLVHPFGAPWPGRSGFQSATSETATWVGHPAQAACVRQASAALLERLQGRLPQLWQRRVSQRIGAGGPPGPDTPASPSPPATRRPTPSPQTRDSEMPARCRR